MTTTVAPYALQIAAAAAHVDVSIDTIRAAIRSGDLPARKIGARWSIRRADLEVWHDQHPTADEAEDA